MCRLNYLVVVFVYSVSLARGFEFDRDSCESLLPNYSKLQPVADHGRRRNVVAGRGASNSAANEYSEAVGDEMKDGRHQLRRQPEGSSPYEITLSDGHYRRNRMLKVSVVGDEFNGLILQARSQVSTYRLSGAFTSLPPSVRDIACQNPSDTVISRDTGGKSNLQLDWVAPDEDEGSLIFTATIVQKDKYWVDIQSEPLVFNVFPPSAAGCGKSKSCYRYSTSNLNCQPDRCDYFVTAKVIEENTIEFTIGGKIKGDNGYIGIGFTMDNIRMVHLDMNVCIKHGNVVDVKQIEVQSWSHGPREHNKMLTDDEGDIDGDMVWCQFQRPLKGIGSHMADLTHSAFLFFVWGMINETSNSPILPPVEQVVHVAEPWNHNNTLNVMHYVGDGSLPIATINIVTTVFAIIISLILGRL